MNDGAIWGIIIGSIGGFLGLVGGLTGTYFSYRRAQSHQERVFILQVAVAALAILSTLLFVIALLSSPFKWLLMVSLAIIGPIAAPFLNRRHRQICREGAAEANG